MNSLSSKQRKLVYMGLIVALFIPIVLLGLPATGDADALTGKLSQLRQEQELGESTLGKVDPASASMNLVLLGMRGVASTVLWVDALEQQEHKDWGRLRATTNSIILLQPHFLKVWDFQGWNLAYNVSQEWDAVPDRYYWVKQGAKFLMTGCERNEKFAELFFHVGRMLGAKVGESDEWRQFRRYFLSDPDPEYEGFPDPQINPERKDNYLTARDWYLDANRREENVGQRIMMRLLFRQYPARSVLDYARTLQREGKFEEQTRLAWSRAFDAWTGDFGQEEYMTSAGVLKLETTPEQVIALAEEEDIDPEFKLQRWVTYRNVCGYDYWRIRAQSEGEQQTIDAHRHLHNGRRLFRLGQTNPRGENGERPSESQAELERGMELMEQVFIKYPPLISDDSSIEEAMLAVFYWQAIHELNNQPLPEDYPLKRLWDANPNRVEQIQALFRREQRMAE